MNSHKVQTLDSAYGEQPWFGTALQQFGTTANANKLPFDHHQLLGLVAPRGTPQEIIDVLAQATREASSNPEVVERLFNLGVVPAGTTPAEFADVLKRDRALYADAIRSAGIPLIESGRP